MKSNLASYSRRLIATAAIVCLSSPIARATVLVNIPFNYTGTLPQSLNSFNSVSLNPTSRIRPRCGKSF